jgi:Mg/Co/Ni transporter MgtE
MNPDVISVAVDTDQEEVANIVRRYDLVNIPVVDDHCASGGPHHP